MNAEQSACASSGKAETWEQIDWPQCERRVRRLQARIVKETQQKRWGKVKALQRLLTCSFSGKALAVKRVTDNQGKRTAGVDGRTWTTHVTHGFDFLGQNVRQFGDKLLTQPSRKNTHNFLEKARQLIRRNGGVSQGDLIRQLNPVVRGWANYHRHSSATRTFKKVERALWISLWQWAKRRHANNGACWIYRRYWHRLGNRWMFAADTGKLTTGGQPLWQKLVYPTQIGVRRFVKIRMEANPFDPKWRGYFKDRAFFKKFGIHRTAAGLKPSRLPAP